MSRSIQRTNRRTALISLGVAIALTAAIAALTPSQQGGNYATPPSTFFTTDGGAGAIYRVMDQLLPKSARWQLPLTELQTHKETRGSTLIAMGPIVPLSEREADELDSWIRSGGQLILATNRTWDIQHLRGDHTKKAPSAGDYLGRHEIHRRPGEGSAAVSASETKTVGKGRIVYVPDSFAFSNETLRATDNAVWIAARVSEWSDAAFFDEYHQGFAARRGFFHLIGLFLFTSPWGFVCLQLGLAGCIYILGTKRRFGKVIEEIPPERTSPLEAAEALGGLFQTAQARVLSIRSIHHYVNMELSRILGHRVDLLNPESRDRVARRSRMNKADLDRYAEAVESALGKAPDRDDSLVSIAGTATDILRSLDYGSTANRRHSAAS